MNGKLVLVHTFLSGNGWWLTLLIISVLVLLAYRIRKKHHDEYVIRKRFERYIK